MSDDSGGQERLTGWAEQVRADAARDRAARVAGRRLLLQCVPGDLSDLDAAAQCECSCHPQPGRPATHASEKCHCQLTDAERHERQQRARAALETFRGTFTRTATAHARELADAAERLGVEVREEVIAAPWVLLGAVDGRRFALRERWGEYTLTIAPDDEPDVDPWGAPTDAAVIVIAAGTEDDLYFGTPPDYGKAVTFIVATIRTYLRRRSCTHPHSPGDRYCPACGTPLVDEAQP